MILGWARDSLEFFSVQQHIIYLKQILKYYENTPYENTSIQIYRKFYLQKLKKIR